MSGAQFNKKGNKNRDKCSCFNLELGLGQMLRTRMMFLVRLGIAVKSTKYSPSSSQGSNYI